MESSVHQTEATLVAALVQLIVIILAARAAGSVAVALHQPRVVGEVVAGLLLGPSFFGHFFPGVSAAIFAAAAAEPITVLSQIGLILLMFQIGAEFEFGRLQSEQSRRTVVYVSIASVSVPLGVGLTLGWISAPLLAADIDALTYSLFVAVALAITAVPVLGRILREYSLNRTEIGVISISAAAANDLVGWVLLAGISAYAAATFSMAAESVRIVGLAALFFIFWLAGRPAIGWLLRRFPIVDGKAPTALVAIVLALIFAAGICTERLGVFTIFGGFLMGLLFHKHEDFVEAWQNQIGLFVLVFFLPIFFTFTGLRTDATGIDSRQDVVWCTIFFVAAVAAKVLPVYAAARFAGLAPGKASVIGVLMNTRGLMELIVLNVGLSLGFLPQDVFTMLVIMAVGTTILTGPLVQFLLRRQGHKVEAVLEA